MALLEQREHLVLRKPDRPELHRLQRDHLHGHSSSASYVAAEKGSEKAAFTCEKTGGTASYLQTTSSVSWPSLGTRPPVSQSSILTVPTSGVLLVKVLNQNNEAVEGATVTVTGTGVNSTQITPTSGCVIFGGLPAEAVAVDASKSTWVDHQGKSPPKAISGLTLSTTSVTETTFKIGEPGSIVVEFEKQWLYRRCDERHLLRGSNRNDIPSQLRWGNSRRPRVQRDTEQASLSFHQTWQTGRLHRLCRRL